MHRNKRIHRKWVSSPFPEALGLYLTHRWSAECWARGPWSGYLILGEEGKGVSRLPFYGTSSSGMLAASTSCVQEYLSTWSSLKCNKCHQWDQERMKQRDLKKHWRGSAGKPSLCFPGDIPGTQWQTGHSSTSCILQKKKRSWKHHQTKDRRSILILLLVRVHFILFLDDFYLKLFFALWVGAKSLLENCQLKVEGEDFWRGNCFWRTHRTKGFCPVRPSAGLCTPGILQPPEARSH